jgi:hypothetical protein
MVQWSVSAVLLLAFSETVHAHFLWLERDGDGPARAYFGEWIDDIREKTGGLLDRFKAPRAFLGKAELTIIGPSKWEKPLVTDEQGRVTLPTPWAGRYVLEVTHFDEKAGGSGEEKFSRTRHISSLSFVQQSGIRWTDKR